MIRKILLVLVTCLMCCSSAIWAQPKSNTATNSSKEPAVLQNRIAAVVNDEIIPESELDIMIDQMRLQFTTNHQTPPSDEKLRQMALNQLISYHLQLQMAARNQIQVTPSEIDDAIDRIVKAHNATLDQLKLQLSQQGINYDDFRKKIGEQIIIGKLQQGIAAGQVKVTDQDVANYQKTAAGPKEFHIADFFVPLPEKYTAAQKQQALAKASGIQQKLNNGVSPDTLSPPYRDLGWRNKDNLPAIFAAQLNVLTLKNASMPLLAPNGYHVLKILEERSPPSTLSDDQIRQLLFRQKFEEAVANIVNKAKGEAYIQIMPANQ
ncbi:MAG: SurA N-terminal domain-containing protein [Proteobacteria bacterium]|nr:SurA N-terminal domain-containing protein [Pseudomonadota bacterium]